MDKPEFMFEEDFKEGRLVMAFYQRINGKLVYVAADVSKDKEFPDDFKEYYERYMNALGKVSSNPTK